MYTTTPAGIRERKRANFLLFKPLVATISASAGIGNVAGSAAAVSIGGPESFSDDYSRTFLNGSEIF